MRGKVPGKEEYGTEEKRKSKIWKQPRRLREKFLPGQKRQKHAAREAL